MPKQIQLYAVNVRENKKGGEGGGFTGEGSGAREGEDAGVAAKVTELAVGKTGEDFAAVAAEEFEVVAMGGRGPTIGFSLDLAGTNGIGGSVFYLIL